MVLFPFGGEGQQLAYVSRVSAAGYDCRLPSNAGSCYPAGNPYFLEAGERKTAFGRT